METVTTTVDHSERTKLTGLLVGRKVVKVADDRLQLDDGRELQIVPNEGCGGCDAGWYRIEELNGCEKIITSVETVASGGYSDDERFQLFVFADNQKINLISVTGFDNGWYGSGYRVVVSKPRAE